MIRRLLTSVGGGGVNDFSDTIDVASFTSSTSIHFFLAWFAKALASSNKHVTYPGWQTNNFS